KPANCHGRGRGLESWFVISLVVDCVVPLVRCSVIENIGLTRRNGSVHCVREYSGIVQSVRIGPPQPRNSFISAISLYPATIRIDKFLNACCCLGPAQLAQ